MMGLYPFQHADLFMLVLLRMAAFIGASPVLSLRVWPAWTKVGLAVFCAIAVAPTVAGGAPHAVQQPGLYVLAALQETLVGLVLGFTATAVFSAVQMAGQVADIQIGYGAASLFDPSGNGSAGPLANFESLLFTMYFLGLNGLDGVILAALHSYQYIPLAGFHWPDRTAAWLAELAGLAMTSAVEVAAPLLAALLLADVTFAFLSRAVPQLNVFVVSLPAKLLLGLGFFAASMSGLVFGFGELFTQLFRALNATLKFLGG